MTAMEADWAPRPPSSLVIPQGFKKVRAGHMPSGEGGWHWSRTVPLPVCPRVGWSRAKAQSRCRVFLKSEFSATAAAQTDLEAPCRCKPTEERHDPGCFCLNKEKHRRKETSRMEGWENMTENKKYAVLALAK